MVWTSSCPSHLVLKFRISGTVPPHHVFFLRGMHRDNCTVYALEPVCRSVALQAFQCITPADTREKNYS